MLADSSLSWTFWMIFSRNGSNSSMKLKIKSDASSLFSCASNPLITYRAKGLPYMVWNKSMSTIFASKGIIRGFVVGYKRRVGIFVDMTLLTTHKYFESFNMVLFLIVASLIWLSVELEVLKEEVECGISRDIDRDLGVGDDMVCSCSPTSEVFWVWTSSWSPCMWSTWSEVPRLSADPWIVHHILSSDGSHWL